jgi:DNA gyrase subunit A
LRDESDRQGMRVVIQLKREAQPQQLLNNLYKYTALQTTFAANMLALVDGQPRVLSLKEALQYFIDFRREVITRRSRHDLKVAKARAHILEGLKVALDSIDRVIATIRRSKTVEAARQNLMSDFGLTRAQAEAILETPLRRLAGMERDKVLEELAEVLKTISYLEDLLGNPGRILRVAKERAEVQVWRPAEDGDKRRGHRPVPRGRPDTAPEGGRDPEQPRLHQAGAHPRLSLPAPGRQGHHRHYHQGGRRRQAAGRGRYP